MQKDNINILQHFINMQQQRSHIQIKGVLEAQMDYMEYIIRSQFDKNTKEIYKFKKRKAQLDEQLINALNSMSRDQKVRYYEQFFTIIKKLVKEENQPPLVNKQSLTCQGFTRSLNLKIWKKKKIRLDVEKHILYAEKSTKIKHYNLENYLIRQSKNKDYHTFVLQAINASPHQNSRTVHLGFNDPKLYKIWFKAIEDSIHYKNWEKICKLMGRDSMRSSESNTVYNKTQSSSQMNVTYKRSNISADHRFGNEPKNQYDSSDDEQAMKSEKKKQVKQQQKVGKKNNQETSKFRQENKYPRPLNNHTIVDSLMESDNDEEIHKIHEKQKRYSEQKKHLDLFHKILPDYQLEDLETDDNYEAVINENNFRVIQHRTNRLKIKVYILFPKNITKEAIFAAIANTTFFTNLNQAVQEMSIKTMIASQNSAIIYQKNKAYNKLYRARDFVYLRHAFSNAGDIYIVDKSLQNSNYPPFITIVRGNLCIFWGILTRKGENTLIIDIEQTNQGYLNQLQEVNLTMQYVQGLKRMEASIKKQADNLLKFKIFDLSWDITKNQKNKISNQIRKRKKTQRNFLKNNQQISKTESKQSKKINESQISFKRKSIPSSSHSQNSKFLPIQNIQSQKALLQEKKVMEVVGQIDPQELAMREKQKTVLSIVRKVDQEGYVIIGNQYIKQKFRTTPTPSMPYVYQEVVIDHPIWKGQWQHDDNQGGIIFINQKKIEDQKGVLKFILAKIGKNILSGKGVLNISLPVDIFAPESNLQRLLFSITYAPVFLQKVCKKSSLQRLKSVIGFGISNSPLYLSMEKPFNPILGETFQCWINGCPAYAEQISHHPPIGAILFLGRGYRISAQLESKVELHMNSGCGTNDGIFRVTFDDGVEVCFITPGGEISGLTYGDRKFNIVGKSYYWIEKDNLVIEIVFNPTKKGFFSVGKQQMPSDYFQGQIYEVKPQFMKSFLNKKKAPNQKQIVKNYGKISGIWNKFINFENQSLLNIDKQYPLKLQYQAHPLPSDANWREDIHYRRIMEVTRAQTQKQRLQVFQRADRKLREAKGKKK